MTINFFVGTWKLVSYETRLKNGQVIYPLGKNPVGYLMYTEDGYMSVNMMSVNRSLWSFKNSKKETLAVAKASRVLRFKAFMEWAWGIFRRCFMGHCPETFLAYSGKYEVLENQVIHYPEISTIYSWIGVRLERTFQMTDNKLFLSPPSSNTHSTSQLVWERV